MTTEVTKTSVPVAVIQELTKLKTQQEALLKEIALTPTIATKEEEGQAGNWLARVRSFLKEAENIRKAIVGPRNDEVKAINAAFSEGLRLARNADGVLDKAISDFRWEQEKARRKEIDRQQKLAENRAAKAEARGEVPAIPEPIAAVLPEVETTIETDTGKKVGQTKHKKWRWANDKQADKATSKLPDSFWVPNEVQIGQMVRAGTPEAVFNGAIIIYDDIGTSVR